MVRADKGSAGVIFTMDTESGFDGVCLVTSAFGLGETVVSGQASLLLLFKYCNLTSVAILHPHA